MKQTGCLFIMLMFVTVILVVLFYQSVQKKFDGLRVEIIHQCEMARPIFAKRYQALQPVVYLYDKQFGWETDEATGIATYIGDPNKLNLPLEAVNRSGIFEGIEMTPELAFSSPIRQGLVHFKDDKDAFSAIMGTVQIESHLNAFIEAAEKYDVIRTNGLMLRLQTDLAGSLQPAEAAMTSVSQAVTRYNEALANSYLGKKWLELSPITEHSPVQPPRPRLD